MRTIFGLPTESNYKAELEMFWIFVVDNMATSATDLSNSNPDGLRR